MGKMEINLDNEIIKLGSEDGELPKAMIFNAAPYVFNVLKGNLEKVIGIGKSKNSSGELAASLGMTKIQQDRSGYWNLKIGFGGKDKNGIRNGLKAGVLEHGKSNQAPRPFVAPTVRTVKKQVEVLMQQAIDEEMRKNGNT